MSRLLDTLALSQWMDNQGLAPGPVEGLVRLAGGTQNVLLSFQRGGRGYVLRRPPAHPRPESNEVMRREARVLAALADTDVPHPRLIAACGADGPIGVAFYLMEPIDGFNATVAMPPLHAARHDMRRAMGFAFVDGAVALGRLNHVDIGLANFGRPEGFLERQVARWQSQYAGYSRYAGWPGPSSLPHMEAVSEYLRAKQPVISQPGLMHGDYSLGNVLFKHDGSELAAIVDWELATIGDPLLDLGWMVASWRGDPHGDLDMLVVQPWEGFPSAEEIVAHYGRHSERDLTAIDWYVVLACFKIAIIIEGTFARASAGEAARETGDKLHETAKKLMDRARRRIA